MTAPVYLLSWDLLVNGDEGELTCADEVVWDAIGEALDPYDDSRPSSEQVQSWTWPELVAAYQWARLAVDGVETELPSHTWNDDE